jgi:hypothetical protein
LSRRSKEQIQPWVFSLLKRSTKISCVLVPACTIRPPFYTAFQPKQTHVQSHFLLNMLSYLSCYYFRSTQFVCSLLLYGYIERSVRPFGPAMSMLRRESAWWHSFHYPHVQEHRSVFPVERKSTFVSPNPAQPKLESVPRHMYQKSKLNIHLATCGLRWWLCVDAARLSARSVRLIGGGWLLGWGGDLG